MKSPTNSIIDFEPESDWLDAALVHAAPADVVDGGFSHRVMAKLPSVAPLPTVEQLRVRLRQQQIKCMRKDVAVGLACLVGLGISLAFVGWPGVNELNQATAMLLHGSPADWWQVVPLSGIVLASWVLAGTLYCQLAQNPTQYA